MARPKASSPETRAFLAQAREVLHQLAILIRNTYFHDLSNEVFRQPLEGLQASLKPILSQEGRFELERLGQELFANGTRIRMELRSVHSYKFVSDELAKRGLGGLRFEAGLSRSGLVGLLSALASIPVESEDYAVHLNEALAANGIEGIKALEPRQQEVEELSSEQDLDPRERAIDTYQQALDFIRKSMAEIQSPAQLNQRRAKRVIQKLVDLSYEDGDGFSMVGLAAIKDHDNYTFNHMVNVCVLAIAFGQRLGLGRRKLAELGLCALYHDLGKLHIPPDVLRKHGPLTEKEWALMGNHGPYAARSLFPLVAHDRGVVQRILSALQHHYGYDGKGYPRLRLLRRQSLYARIIAIVDVFDAMTTKRVYQEKFLPDGAMRIISKRAGEYCDPLLVKAFINCMGIFPVGSTVRLATGELAVVVESNPDPEKLDQPRVRVVTDSRGDFVEPFLVELSQPSQRDRRITKGVDPEEFGINSAHYAI